MKTKHRYTVNYRMSQFGEQKSITIYESSKELAYDQAMWLMIPGEEGTYAYSAWVADVTYKTGRTHTFNTSEGNAY